MYHSTTKNMLSIDNNNFLTVWDRKDSTKSWAIRAWGEVWTESDHDVLVRHKQQIKTIAWKDLGNTMQLIRLVSDTLPYLNTTTDMSPGFVASMLSVLTRYAWYDEETNTSYYYLPNISGTKLEGIIQQFHDFLGKQAISMVNHQHGRYTLDIDLSQVSDTYVLAQYLWLCLVYGKPTIVKQQLRSYRIQLSALQHDILEQVETIVQQLRKHYLVINSSYNSQSQQIQVDSSDPILLSYIQILLNDPELVVINNILEVQEEITRLYTLPNNLSWLRWKLYTIKR